MGHHTISEGVNTIRIPDEENCEEEREHKK